MVQREKGGGTWLKHDLRRCGDTNARVPLLVYMHTYMKVYYL